MNNVFHKLSSRASTLMGSPYAFVISVAIIVLWAISGSTFNYSDTWQLVINTGTTIVTFLMVFLIQNTQNRDARAIHLKLDELLRSSKGARNSMVDIEELNDQELEVLHTEFKLLHEKYSTALSVRKVK